MLYFMGSGYFTVGFRVWLLPLMVCSLWLMWLCYYPRQDDQTRVTLIPLPDDPHSDYYNACYVDVSSLSTCIPVRAC